MSPPSTPPGKGGLARLDGSSLRVRAAQAIRASIVSEKIQAGHIYSVGYFASDLGVSATPVREALFDLAGTGIVELVRNRGFRVPILTERDLDDLLELRLLLERPAIVGIAERRVVGNPTKLRRMSLAITQCARDGDVVGFLTADRLFHGELLRRGQNQRLASVVMAIRDQMRLSGVLQLAQSGQLEASASEHDELLAALESGKSHKTQVIMTRHLLHTRGIWVGKAEDGTARGDVSAPGSITDAGGRTWRSAASVVEE